MKRNFRYFIIGMTLLLGIHLNGQECGMSTIEDAEKDYTLGKFENTLSMLNGCLEIGAFTTYQEEDAYRILAWTYIALDSLVDAQEAVIQLLNINPAYTSRSDDPIAFRNLVYDIRLGFFDLQVTSVSKKPENVKETPASVMVITAEDIRNRGYIDLESIFNDLPGFDISRTFGNTYSNIYQRGYRSNNTDRTLFLVDGVEENDLWSNVAYLSRQYPLSNVKRVEVVYGPASTMYGANAFLGVINVITKDADDLLSGKNHHLYGEVSMGGFDTKYGELTYATRKNNVTFTTTGRLFSSAEIDLSGFSEFDYNPSDYDTIDYKSLFGASDLDPVLLASPYFNIENNAAVLSNAGIEAARNFDKGIVSNGPDNQPIRYSNISDHYFVSTKLKVNNFTVGYQYWQSKHSTGNYGTDNTRAGADYGGIWSPSQSFINATYSRDINKKLTFTNIAQYRINRVAQDSRTVTLQNYSNGKLGAYDLLEDQQPFWQTTYFYQISRQFRNETKLNYQPFRGLDIVTGLEVRNSAIQGNYRNLTFDGISFSADTLSVIEEGVSSLDTVGGGNKFSVYDYGVYLQGSYHVTPDLNLTLGGRMDYNRVRESGGYGTIFNPRVALVYTPGKAIFKVIMAQAFKDATNFQKYATGPTRLFNNPTLQPEKVTNYESSIGYNVNKKFFVDGAFYYSKYSGAIAPKTVNIDGVVSTRNEAEGSLEILGFQTSAQYKIGNYSIYGNYSYVLPKVEKLDTNGVGTNEFIRIGDIASHRLNLGVNATYFKNLNINLRANFASRRPVGPETSVNENILGDFPSFALLNGAITYKNLIPGLQAQLSVSNMLDHAYSDPGIRSADGISRPYRIPQRGLFAMFKLSYDL